MYKILTLIALISSIKLSAQDVETVKSSLFDPRVVFIRQIREHNPKQKVDSYSISSLEKSAYFIRFDSVLVHSPEKGYDLLKVFKSDRYFEESFKKRYKKISYLSDTDGFHYLAKLTYSDSTNTELEIYPQLITNVCRKKMHGRKCGEKKKCKSTYDFHIQKLCSYAENIKKSTHKVNAQIWYETAIKGFELNVEKDAVVVALSKSYTKHASSDDELLENFYQFKRLEVKADSLFGEAVFAKANEDTAEDITPGVNVSDSVVAVTTVDRNNQLPIPVDVPVPSEEKIKGWVYAGKLKNIPISDTAYVFLNKPYIYHKDGDNWITATSLNLRISAPEKRNNVWKKGAIIKPTVPENYPIRRLSQKFIPGIDGYPLLWLEVEFRKP